MVIMKFYADLHIHSRYSRATSSRLVPEILDRWAQVKGLALVGTGDFTHPGWFSELREKLMPAEEGLFILSPEARRRAAQDPEIASIPTPPRLEGWELPEQTRFILSAEISTIYSWGGRVRKVHHVILAPSFEAVSRIQDRLSRIGNLASDGRPILGLDSRDLLEIVLEADPACVLIPAHIWTPWFSVLGSKSGFDSIREAYRDLAGYVFVIETGLSSDPPMNWLCTALDSYAILSNSDAHSPENLAREANKFDTELSYPAIVAALREAAGNEKGECGGTQMEKAPSLLGEDRKVSRGSQVAEAPTATGKGRVVSEANLIEEAPTARNRGAQGQTSPNQGPGQDSGAQRNNGGPNTRLNGKISRGGEGFLGTVEFFPQEGKYHFDGHRKCGVVMNPIETARLGGKCPACGKPLTVGVMNRVIGLADRVQLEDRPRRKDFVSLIPLKEILSELMGMGTGSRALEARYHDLIKKGGPELWLLSEASLESIERIGGASLAEGIKRMRERRVHVQEGYDGEYGHVWVFGPGVTSLGSLGASLFPDLPKGKGKEETLKPRGLLDFDIRDLAALKQAAHLSHTNNRNQADSMNQVPPPRGAAHPNQASLLDNNLEQTSRPAQAPGWKGSLQGKAQEGEVSNRAQPRSLREPTEVVAGESLNEEQRKAVEYEGGPLLILAGPGTGKTNTLTHRIAYLLKRGIPPENILALTFTHKAAEEMRSRLGRILEAEVARQKEAKGAEQKEAEVARHNETRGVKIRTFHSFGLDILKEFHPRFGRSESFILLSESDTERILKSLAAKGEKIEESPGLRTRYKEFLKELDAFDMDDLLQLPVVLLEEDPETRAEFRRRYTHLFVDEYQDVNEPQYRLLRLLALDASSHLTVIGDTDQAIYGFRGASVEFIRRFTSDYPRATVLSLSTSYRCPEAVLKAARQVIEAGTAGGRVGTGNDFQAKREPRQAMNAASASVKMPQENDREVRVGAGPMEPRNPGAWDIGSRGKGLSPLEGLPGDLKIQISHHPSDAAEAEFIARTIENLTGGFRFFSMDSGVSDGGSEEYDPGEIAVLCRTTRQMECLEKAFHDHAVPYLKVGERSYLQEEPVASLLDLARLLTSPRNAYFKTIVSQRIRELFHRNWIASPLSPEEIVKKGKKGLSSKSLPARGVLENLIEALGFTESIQRSFDMERLFALALDRSLAEFLYVAATRSNQDDLPYRTSRVTLSTIHGVKGLEFTGVFIAGCEEGLLPYTLFSDGKEPTYPEKTEATEAIETDRRVVNRVVSREDIEEERRLFYVGMTRAKRYLHLSWAERRFLFGREYRLGPSSFLLSIEEDLLKRLDPEYKKRPLDRQLSLF
jgi:DNA helicase-2/ATP-dependent DNA helicase PcrA